MASNEQRFATKLRADAALMALLPGGIYTAETLGVEGLTNPTTTPGAYSGGRLLACLMVRAREPVPGLRVSDPVQQHADSNQAVVCWVYSRDATALMPIFDRIYTILHEKPMAGGWAPKWSGTQGPRPALDNSMGPGVHFVAIEFWRVSIRRPLPA